jgi:hypothetical protein
MFDLMIAKKDYSRFFFILIENEGEQSFTHSLTGSLSLSLRMERELENNKRKRRR